MDQFSLLIRKLFKESQQRRLKGNELLTALVNSTLAPAIKECRLDAVIKEYLWAVNTAQNSEDSLSALKNLGVAYSKKLDFFIQNPERCQSICDTYRNLTGTCKRHFQLGMKVQN